MNEPATGAPEITSSDSSRERKAGRFSCGCWFSLACLGVFAVVLFLCISHFRIFDAPLAVENFDSEENGWLVMGDAQGDSNQPTWQESGGNPGGYMEAVDDAVGGVWYWAAPESFRQTVSQAWKAEGGRSRAVLTFDLRQSDRKNPFEKEDVIISDGDLTLSYLHNSPPELNWTSYQVPLAVTAGWKNEATGEPASDEEMTEVLQNLEKLWIRGEFRTGPDTGGLDNVVVR